MSPFSIWSDFIKFRTGKPPAKNYHGDRATSEEERALTTTLDYDALRKEISWKRAKDDLGIADGQPINIAHLCVDRNVERGLGDKIAMIHEDHAGEVRQFSYHDVKRFSNGWARFLSDRGVGESGLPHGHQVLQVAPRGGHGRDLRHFVGGAPRQDRLVAIHPAVAEPRLGRPHGAVGHLGPLAPGILADGKLAALLPRQIEGPAARLVLAGQVEERR